jgi:hypothetical protein
MLYPQEVRDYVMSSIKAGKTSSEIYAGAKLRGYTAGRKTFNKYIYMARKKADVKAPTINTSNIEESFFKIVKSNSSIKLTHLCNILNCTPATIDSLIEYHKIKGCEIVTDGHQVYINKYTPEATEKIKQIGTTEVRFAVASDLHFGSKACQITALNTFCEVARGRGIKHIFVPGDVVAGLGVYPGQINDLYAITSDEQVQSVLANLPRGFDWYLLGGNHDYSFIKGNGHNIIQAIASQREDIHYLGFDDVEIPILNNVDAKLIHPSGGNPYAYSYKLQKNIEQISYSELRKMAWGSKEKPSIRFVFQGHLHTQVQAMFGSIFGAQCGCFEGTTNYLKRLGLTPTVGGYIISACLGSNGLLYDYEARFFTYDEIENDWKNYHHNHKSDDSAEKIIKPLFEK